MDLGFREGYGWRRGVGVVSEVGHRRHCVTGRIKSRGDWLRWAGSCMAPLYPLEQDTNNMLEMFTDGATASRYSGILGLDLHPS